jgi:hypothetical protein
MISKIVTALAMCVAVASLAAQSADSIEMAHIPAGSFAMGAEAAALPPAVVNGFGVMSTRRAPSMETSTRSPHTR